MAQLEHAHVEKKFLTSITTFLLYPTATSLAYSMSADTTHSDASFLKVCHMILVTTMLALQQLLQ